LKTLSLKYVFGPVPSRRLGKSLGVDLLVPKTCTFDCIYCQVGRTTEKSVVRAESVPLDDVLAELSQALATIDRPDHISLAGSGEPTLYLRLGELIDRIHAMTDVPVAVLTNGSLFSDPQVRDEVGRADRILPSLDAADEPTFLRINRPAGPISFEKFLSGLRAFCQTFGPKIWLEIFLIPGINDSDDHVGKLAEIAKQLGVVRVQLNTAVRPGTEASVQPIERNRLVDLAQQFDPPAEVIADFPEIAPTGRGRTENDAVLNLLRRRPCTLQDITAGLNLTPAEIEKIIEILVREGKIRQEQRQGRLYYLAT
jgi:wyosine [tRNA(Phe)-imidazoG37] synthetase (radical SAM superfamily)